MVRQQRRDDAQKSEPDHSGKDDIERVFGSGASEDVKSSSIHFASRTLKGNEKSLPCRQAGRDDSRLEDSE